MQFDNEFLMFIVLIGAVCFVLAKLFSFIIELVRIASTKKLMRDLYKWSEGIIEKFKSFLDIDS